ncbi:hypothetical protein C8F01DRAFT_1143033 [Mycena amicta]|nr:hypothetical protein C8F01DRAFT_1143033 [Mycena amicta]
MQMCGHCHRPSLSPSHLTSALTLSRDDGVAPPSWRRQGQCGVVGMYAGKSLPPLLPLCILSSLRRWPEELAEWIRCHIPCNDQDGRASGTGDGRVAWATAEWHGRWLRQAWWKVLVVSIATDFILGTEPSSPPTAPSVDADTKLSAGVQRNWLSGFGVLNHRTLQW